MKRVIECVGVVLVEILFMVAVMAIVVIIMPLWIVAEIFGEE